MGAYMGKEEFSDQGKRQQSLLHMHSDLLWV